MSKDEQCAVHDCAMPVKARHLCAHHYNRYVQGKLTEPHTTLAGFLAHGSDPVVCHCDRPRPDRIGQCAWCGRKVVTYVDPKLVDRYREQYPDAWERATQLSMFPDVAPDVEMET
jgi:hypothetical protein